MLAFFGRLFSARSEPLFVFFVLGVAVFSLYELVRDPQAFREPEVIVVSDADIRRLTTGFEATWRRAPSAAEIEILIGEHVVEEAFVREALALGLDRGDAVIRRRLRQKMAFIAEAGGDADAPDDDALRAHFAAHPERFATAPRVAFEQVFLGRGPQADEAATLLVALSEGADPGALGAPTMLPPSVQLVPESVVASIFGPGFFAAVAAQQSGRWVGPVISAHGSHLVRVTVIEPAATPAFETVRDRVESDWRATQAQARREAFMEELLERYRVERADSTLGTAP
jgi:hypothetical protein